MEFEYDEASALKVKVQDQIMGRLIEVIVVDGLRLVQQHLLAIGIDWCHYLLLF